MAARRKTRAQEIEKNVAQHPQDPDVVEQQQPVRRGNQKARPPEKESHYTITDLENLGLRTTSAKARFLKAKGWPTSAIADFLGKRYQHIRNVLITPVREPRD